VLNDFARAVGQLSDPRFLRVFFLSILMTVALLGGASALWWWATGGIADMELTLLGFSLSFLDTAVEWIARFGGVLILGFLMMPVASMFIGLFLEEIADAVEAKHYPHARGTRKMPWTELLADGFVFTLTLLAANACALILYLIFLPIGPFIFIAVNGWFLGRQYFELVAARHAPFPEARALRRRFMIRVWIAGCLMAAPLSVPLLGLFVPVLGVASFTHMHHRLVKKA
jgi:CysZ protein